MSSELLSGQGPVRLDSARSSFFTFCRAAAIGSTTATTTSTVAGVRLSFTRQGFFRVDQGVGAGGLAGRRLQAAVDADFGQRAAVSLAAARTVTYWGPATYYDEVDPFAGSRRAANVDVTFQPSGRFTQDVECTHNTFDRESTGERVYTVNILNTRPPISSPRSWRSGHRAIRQPAAPRPHRFPGLLRSAPGHSRLRRLRLPLPEARVPQRCVD